MMIGALRLAIRNTRRLALAALPVTALCIATACGQQADTEDAASDRSAHDTPADAETARREPPRAQSPTPEDPQPNAADEYRRIWNAIDEEDYFTIAESRDDPTREVEELLNETWDLYEALVEATKLDHCDWGIDYSDGLDTSLPHLGHLRRLARFLTAHVNSAVRWTDMDRARDATLSLVRMSRHVDDKSPIENLVAMAIVAIGAELIIDYQDEWRESDRRMMLDELRRFDTEDPFDLEASIEWHRRLSAEADHPPPDEELIRAVRSRVLGDIREAIDALR